MFECYREKNSHIHHAEKEAMRSHGQLHETKSTPAVMNFYWHLERSRFANAKP